MKKLSTVLLCAAFALAVGCKKDDKKKPEPKPEPKPDTAKQPEPKPEPTPEPAAATASWATPDDLKYMPIDPKNADGPQIAVVHGNPNEDGVSAFFLKLPADFNPGVHTHTNGYHAVMVSGNHKHWLAGDKKQEELTTGGYWYQPGTQAHGDHCVSKDGCVAFIVTDGKFDFIDAKDAKPVGKDRGDYTLVHAKDAKWAPMDPSNPKMPVKMAPLFGDPKEGPFAFEIEMPGGFENPMHKHTNEYFAVILTGTAAHWLEDGKNKDKAMPPGSFWYQPGTEWHEDGCRGDAACRGWVFMNGAMDFTPKDAGGGAPK